MFLEWNTNLPGYSTIDDQVELTVTAPQQPDTNMRVGGGARSIAEPTVIPNERMKFLEANELPGDHTPYYPDPSQSGGSTNAY